MLDPTQPIRAPIVTTVSKLQNDTPHDPFFGWGQIELRGIYKKKLYLH